MTLIFKNGRVRRNGGRYKGCPTWSPQLGGAFGRLSRRALRPIPGRCSCVGPQFRKPHQVVSPRYEVAPSLSALQSAISAPAQPTHRLDPTNNLFDPFADSLAGRVTGLLRRAPVQAFDFNAGFARHMRRDLALAATVDMP